MLCKNCGNQITSQDKFCMHCGAKIPEFQQAPEPFRDPVSQTSFNAGNYSLPTLADGEKIVKKYFCSSLDFPKCEGHIAVTNRRVIFHGQGDNSNRIVQEVDIQEVKGVSSYFGTNYNWKRIIIGSIITLLSLVLLSNSSSGYSYGIEPSFGMSNFIEILAIIIGIYIIISGIKKIFVLKVLASSCSPAIFIGETPTSSVGNSAMFAIIGQPTSQTNQMMAELGALIIDLQTLGDLAYEKWSLQ